MFGLFKSASYSDPVLGELVHSRGYWRGKIHMESGATKLALAGTRAAPDSTIVAAARKLKTQLAAWRPSIETALFEHYEPYADAAAVDDDPDASEAFPSIASASEVWPHAVLEFISIAAIDEVLTTELGYAVAWDDEHTLGARFAGGSLVELCGSVLPP